LFLFDDEKTEVCDKEEVVGELEKGLPELDVGRMAIGLCISKSFDEEEVDAPQKPPTKADGADISDEINWTGKSSLFLFFESEPFTLCEGDVDDRFDKKPLANELFTFIFFPPLTMWS